MKRILITSLSILCLSPAASAQRSPLPEREPRFTATISGTVQLTDCNASPANVRISTGTRSVQPRPVESNDFIWSYTITGLTPGTYTVRPVMAIAFCRGGAWLPPTREVVVETMLTSPRDVNFSFRGRRDTTRIGGILLASLIGSAFDGMAIHLNNYRPERHSFEGRDSWHVPNDSSITMPASRGSTTVPFTLLEVSQGPLRYYVRDLNLRRISTRAERGAFLVSLFFEDSGPSEIKGHCSNTTGAIDVACPAGSDSTAPDFEINQARLDMRFAPARAAGGGLTYGPVRVIFNATVRGAGVGSVFETRVKREIKRSVESIMMGIVDQPAMRAAVADAIAPHLRRVGVGDVINVRMEGRDVVIESYPR